MTTTPLILRILAAAFSATAAAVIVMVGTGVILANSVSEDKTTSWVYPIITLYVIGYCSIAFVVLGPVILLLDRLTQGRKGTRIAMILSGGPVFGVLAAYPLFHFQRSGVLLQSQDGHLSLAAISDYFLLLGGVAGFFGSAGFFLADYLMKNPRPKFESEQDGDGKPDPAVS